MSSGDPSTTQPSPAQDPTGALQAQMSGQMQAGGPQPGAQAMGNAQPVANALGNPIAQNDGMGGTPYGGGPDGRGASGMNASDWRAADSI